MEQLSLFDIDFPIYAITKTYKRVWEEHNVLFIETNSGTYILDNKNMTGDTIGQRRLKINNSKLYIPRKIIYNISQLINSKYSTFIDTNGKFFNYIKTKFVPLKYFKVNSIHKCSDGECIISVNKINYNYKINCRKAYSINYVGLLCTEIGYIPVDFSDEIKPNSKRKI
jgi:hypothetical protein